MRTQRELADLAEKGRMQPSVGDHSYIILGGEPETGYLANPVGMMLVGLCGDPEAAHRDLRERVRARGSMINAAANLLDIDPEFVRRIKEMSEVFSFEEVIAMLRGSELE